MLGGTNLFPAAGGAAAALAVIFSVTMSRKRKLEDDDDSEFEQARAAVQRLEDQHVCSGDVAEQEHYWRTVMAAYGGASDAVRARLHIGVQTSAPYTAQECAAYAAFVAASQQQREGIWVPLMLAPLWMIRQASSGPPPGGVLLRATRAICPCVCIQYE